MDLNVIRENINSIDSQILDLLERRYDLVSEVAKYKAENHKAITDKSREEEMLSQLSARVANRSYAPFIVDSFCGIIEASKAYQKLMLENIVLIGMPGCGKSTVGRYLSEHYGYTFIDADEEFLVQNGITPAQCITEYGEPEFRKRETAVLESFRPYSHSVIATGGGVVTIPDNFEIIKPLGMVVYIKRSLDKLTSKGRPISVGKGVERLFEERKALYELWADLEVENIEVKKTAESIIEVKNNVEY